MTSLRMASALLGLLAMNLAMGQPNDPVKMSEEDVARSKEASALLDPMFASDGKKSGYTWQVARVAPSFHDKARFHESFDVGLRHALDRAKKGTGADWKVELQRREKIAKEKFGRSLWEIAVIKIKYKETRDELLLSDADVIALIQAMEALPRGTRDEVALRRLRQGALKSDKVLPDPVPLPKK